MAILLEKYKLLFLHIPKTGGRWVLQVFKDFKECGDPNLKWTIVGPTHGNLNQAHVAYSYQNKNIYDWAKECYTYTFIRHPLSWYQSYWMYVTDLQWRICRDKTWPCFEEKEVWHPTREIRDCASWNFNDFIKKVLEKHPSYLSRLYNTYIHFNNVEKINFIGKQENLTSDFISVLKSNNVDCDYGKIDKIEKVGVAKKRSRDHSQYEEKLKKQILYSERSIIEEFYT